MKNLHNLARFDEIQNGPNIEIPEAAIWGDVDHI